MESLLSTLLNTTQSLLLPLAAFTVIGVLRRRRALLDDLRRVLPQSVLNLKLTFFNAIVVAPVLVAIGHIPSEIADGLDLGLNEQWNWSAWPPLLVAFLAVFVGDFVGYWRHRLEHVPLLWPSHSVHHSDDQMTWLTLQRFHPVNRLSTYVIDTGVLALAGFPPYALVANNLLRHFYGYLIHANLPWTYGPAAYVFVSPAMHRWHHAADPHFFQKNFATVFSIFDRLFGTYCVPGPCRAPLGVTDGIERTLFAQLCYMFERRAYRAIKAGTATPFRWHPAEGGVRNSAAIAVGAGSQDVADTTAGAGGPSHPRKD